MRSPNNGRRPRGRQNRRPSQPMRNTVYDSNGPDVRVRGNAGQICEKYLALARDAASAGDMVKMEACYQFAEHYQRILNSLKTDRDNSRPNPRDARTDTRNDSRSESRNDQRNDNRNDNQRAEGQRGQNRNNQTRNEKIGAETEGEAAAPLEVIESANQTSNTNSDESVAPSQETIDLSEAEQPSIDVELEAITAAATQPAKPAPKPAPKRAPRKPRAKPADSSTDEKETSPAKPRSRVRKAPDAANEAGDQTNENGQAKESKQPFDDMPLPGFLGGGD